MQIHELDNFLGSIGDDTVLAIDDGTETCKIPANAMLNTVLVLEKTTFSSLPQTFENNSITEDMVCIKAELSNPAAQTGDWTVTTNGQGQAIVSGSINGSTALKLYLMKSR